MLRNRTRWFDGINMRCAVIVVIVGNTERFLAPKMDLLKRSTNLHRSKVRPTEPRDINFEMDLGFISTDEFLVKDIQGEGFRHIVFATRYQLELLAETKVWYMDGTFKIVPDFLKPRGQLLSLHGFVYIYQAWAYVSYKAVN